eukprot:TRINITY_DN9916_c0_g1_i1.p1 TRINITY_DN9916_c0_g1~~TRINITY_DN9916_c0_g1_i1.p1  ORF type:complete len:570 (+),score=153.13 TRINITY_DN9916_c0_g1_i1:163-1710(+)
MAINATVDERCQFLELALKDAEIKQAQQQDKIAQLEKQLNTPVSTNSNDDVAQLQAQIEHLQGQLKEYKNNDASVSIDESRIEDERKQVEDMKQDMEALQAMVVAQTAQLAMDNTSASDVDLLKKELQQTQEMLTKAQARCEHATMDKEKATAALQDALEALQQERRIRSNLQHQLNKPKEADPDLQTAQISTLPPPALNRAPSGGSMIALQHVSQIAKLETENRSLKAQLRQMRKRASSSADPDLVVELRANLARACADIARLTVEVDQARNADSNKARDYKSYEVEIDQVRQQRDTEVKKVAELKALLQETDQQLQTALHAMRAVREQACVEVAVRKETIHTRQKKGGFVPVNRSEEVSKVTWFTDETVKSVKTGAWQPAEDRILLQAQLQHGNNWIEMAKLLPGRTDESIRERYSELVSDLLPDSRDGLEASDVIDTQPAAEPPAKRKESVSIPLDLHEYENTSSRKLSTTYESIPSAYGASSRQQQATRHGQITPLVDTNKRSSGDMIVVV